MRRSSVSKLVLGAGAALVMSSVLTGYAWAHAAYRDSDPPDEGTVSSAPGEIWAEYTEPPTDASYLEVFDPCGRQVDDGNSRAEASSNRVYIGMAGNTAGEYRVEWFVDSAVDAHSTRGEFTFTVTNGEPCPGGAQMVEEDRQRDGSGRARDEGAGTGGGGAEDDGGAVAAGSTGSGQSDTGQRSRTRRRDHRSSGTRDEHNRSNRDGRRPAVAQPAGAPNEENENETNIFTGIPIWGLAIALGFAAAIGAAGGFIYAGIMGYTRRA